MDKVYLISEFSHEDGIGELLAVCSGPQGVVNYLTKDGHAHGRLTDEHDTCGQNGVDVVDVIENRSVLKFIPDDTGSGLMDLLGAENPSLPSYYIIHVYDVFDKFFK